MVSIEDIKNVILEKDANEQEILNEFISLRTGLIGAGLAKTGE